MTRTVALLSLVFLLLTGTGLFLIFAGPWLFPSPAPTGVNGTWTFDVDFLDARGGNVTFVLRQEGELLTGSYRGAYGTADLQGTVTGDAIQFSFETEPTGPVTFEGTIDESSMKGTCDYSEVSRGTWEARRRGARLFWW